MYRQKPFVELDINGEIQVGVDKAREVLLKSSAKVIALELYPGIDSISLVKRLEIPEDIKVIHTDDYCISKDKYWDLIKRNVTEDRVFGKILNLSLKDIFKVDAKKQISELIKRINSEKVILVGVGSRLLFNAELTLYFDITRWELQQRQRRGEIGNWLLDNQSEDPLVKYKIGYFIEWRFANNHKMNITKLIDYYIDCNDDDNFKMIKGSNYLEAMQKNSTRPFRLVPFFDQAVWGGQWMKEHFDLDKNEDNYGWSFDGVPDENSILYKIGNDYIEIPAVNLILQHPVEVLGEFVYSRFGANFPIRFNYLDTVGGANLSLQVHPQTDYIQREFGMNFTQDESYYIMDATNKSKVYLGVKEKIDKEEMFNEFEISQKTGKSFEADRYVNTFKVKKHDHILIPAGTIHCSGPDTVVLEISATVNWFTFKLWDWGRLGLDGLPRPVHLEHGKPNVLLSRDTAFCEKELINNVQVVSGDDGHLIEKTGLHNLEFIETHRHWIKESAIIDMHNSVNVLNLIEGKHIKVISENTEMDIYYGETFIVPESCKSFKIINCDVNNTGKIGVIQAFIKGA